MRYPTFAEGLLSLAASAAFGALCFAFLLFLYAVRDGASLFVRVPKRAFALARVPSLSGVFSAPTAKPFSPSRLSVAVCDVLFVFYFAIGYSLLSYLFCDGALRLYTAAVALIVFFALKRCFTRHVLKVFKAVLSMLCRPATLICFLLFLPPVSFARFLSVKILRPLHKRILTKKERRLDARLRREKCEEVRRFLLFREDCGRKNAEKEFTGNP